jgi:DNA-directed RNA polymerase specialized sigma24 family protein
MTTLTTDRQCVERVLAGDLDGYGELHRRYFEPTVRLVTGILAGDRAAAEDTVQEAYLAALEALPRLSDGDRFFPWLKRIAVNRAIELRRSRQRKERLPEGQRAAVIPRYFDGLPLRQVAEALGCEEVTAPGQAAAWRALRNRLTGGVGRGAPRRSRWPAVPLRAAAAVLLLLIGYGIGHTLGRGTLVPATPAADTAERAPTGEAVAALVLASSLATVAGAQEEARQNYLQAREQLIEERYEAALAGFRRVVSDFPESAEADDAQFYVGYVLERLGRTEQAVAAYAELLRRWPDSTRAESARERQVALMGRGGDPAYAGALETLLVSGASWELRREVALSLARQGDLSGASVLEEIMRRESSSRQLDLVAALAPRVQDSTARRIVLLALEPGHSSSLQLKALEVLAPVATQPDAVAAAEVREVARVGLRPNTSSSVQLEAVRALAEGANEESSAAALLELFRSHGIGTSVQLEALEALARYMATPSGPLALAGALSPENSTSVQLKAVELASRHTEEEHVRSALTRLVAGEVSTSVQLAVVEQLGPYREGPAVRRVIIGALRRQNATSVQLKAIEILAGKEDQEDVRYALVGTLEPERSTSVILAAMERLDPWVGRADLLAERYLKPPSLLERLIPPWWK